MTDNFFRHNSSGVVSTSSYVERPRMNRLLRVKATVKAPDSGFLMFDGRRRENRRKRAQSCGLARLGLLHLTANNFFDFGPSELVRKTYIGAD
jgi:hypothetical protein